MALRVYCWLLYLYPARYRHDFGQEMKSVYGQAISDLPPELIAKISFYQREFWGLVSGALRAHLDRLFGPAMLSRRFDMQPQFRFPRSTVLLMLVIFAAVILTIAKAMSVSVAYGATPGTVWPSLISVFGFMAVSMCAAAAVVLGILRALRRSGVHRLERVRVEPNGNL